MWERPVKASLLVLVLVGSLAPHDIITTRLTYTREISRIFEHRCISCHGQESSIPLTSYEQVRPWAVGIKEQVLSRSMPPWGAVKGFGDFKPDRGLTQEEVMIVAAWVIGGAPKGDPALLASSVSTAKGIDAEPHLNALPVVTPAVLRSAVRLVSIKPLETSTIASARITATLPDGHIEPLLWLFNYDGRSHTSFHLRRTMDLPAGTVVQSTATVRLALQTARATAPAP